MRNLSRQVAAEFRLRPRGHWDLPKVKPTTTDLLKYHDYSSPLISLQLQIDCNYFGLGREYDLGLHHILLHNLVFKVFVKGV